MTATVYDFMPRPPMPRSEDLHVPAAKIEDITGYRRPAEQLRMLHELGFVRAYIPKIGRKRVLLEVAHFEAVSRGQFGAAPAPQKADNTRSPGPNTQGLVKFFKNRKQ